MSKLIAAKERGEKEVRPYLYPEIKGVKPSPKHWVSATPGAVEFNWDTNDIIVTALDINIRLTPEEAETILRELKLTGFRQRLFDAAVGETDRAITRHAERRLIGAGK